MSYSVLLSDRAATDIETVLRWFSEQRATTAGKRWLATLLEKSTRLNNVRNVLPWPLKRSKLVSPFEKCFLGVAASSIESCFSSRRIRSISSACGTPRVMRSHAISFEFGLCNTESISPRVPS